MAGLVPAIHAFSLKTRNKDMDARDERGHDAGEGETPAVRAPYLIESQSARPSSRWRLRA
jgi:hypothetical protein